jgi:uncharacterized membrane protein
VRRLSAAGFAESGKAMKKHISIFLTGLVVIIPLAVTIYVIRWISVWLDSLGAAMFGSFKVHIWPGVGAVVVLAAIYLTGLLARFWLFRSLLGHIERLIARVPGVKTVYESVRDLMGLFGGDSKRMGRVVEYSPPGTQMTLLGILTNERPPGVVQDPRHPKVAVYLPYSYMFGGMTVYVDPGHVRTVDMPVEQALKLCAIAQVGGRDEQTPAKPAEDEPKKSC